MGWWQRRRWKWWWWWWVVCPVWVLVIRRWRRVSVLGSVGCGRGIYVSIGDFRLRLLSVVVVMMITLPAASVAVPPPAVRAVTSDVAHGGIRKLEWRFESFLLCCLPPYPSPLPP
ncbi:hypothetical protein L2E82_23093 [Cichorium intybus]|uniref:Uncharacterized protein n=1 Tax=Cichorium intybus TaxID=13427 RepID=A0ACB9DZJ8_CICIN|nr:hypothetical protein L2E82_23093 [Cichorium intybus]